VGAWAGAATLTWQLPACGSAAHQQATYKTHMCIQRSIHRCSPGPSFILGLGSGQPAAVVSSSLLTVMHATVPREVVRVAVFAAAAAVEGCVCIGWVGQQPMLLAEAAPADRADSLAGRLPGRLLRACSPSLHAAGWRAGKRSESVR